MNTMKKIPLVLFLLAGLFLSAHAQKTMLKTNIPYWLTASPNLGAEFAVADNVSIELSAGFNPFKFGSDKQLKHWVIWPEARYWLNETYNGHFFGFHGVGGQFDMGGVDIPIWKLKNLKDRRYDGSAIGFGISYGYQWILSSRWGLEATLGIGYARFDYDIYSVEDGSKIGENKKDYFGPSKGAISITYVIN
jgi:hypothetical protein